MKKTKKTSEDRRRFLKGMATGTVASLVAGTTAAAAVPLPAEPQRGTAPVPAPETDPVAEVLTVDRPGADFMTDVIKSLGFEYIVSNPGSSFRALQESLINYGGNKSPEWLTCMHEESSVAMAHGYAEVENKPLLAMDGGAAARVYGGLQRLRRARTDLHCAGQHAGCGGAPSGCRVDAQRARRCGHGARLHEMGRLPGFAAALCRIGSARVQDFHDVAPDAGGGHRGRWPAGETD
jgi:hypothetical protein